MNIRKLLSFFLLPSLLFFIAIQNARSQSVIDQVLPVRALCIASPKPANLARFVKFINEELSVNHVNTLILRVDYNYQYESHPELRDSISLSKQEVLQLVEACKQHHIQLIPQVNLLGHQSWRSTTSNLLKSYPQFDETPHVQMPLKYEWPNADGLYCKSYCPLHPDVHAIVFDLVDEICDVFETTIFHAGMDEVFYLADSSCPRCKGKDKAMLFAGEVNTIRNHLQLKGRKLWIWGDRLIDGSATGIGEWEGSYNNTQPAVDLISKDVTICDWHYEKPEQTALYFAGKGLDVITCTWRTPSVGLMQTRDMVKFRKEAKSKMKKHFKGIMQTVWSNTASFLDEYYAAKMNPSMEAKSPANCFIAILDEINKLSIANE